MSSKPEDELALEFSKVKISEEKKDPQVKKSPGGISLSLKGVAKAIKDGKIKNIIVMTGAGISCSAGIPDFRTPGTGLYSQLEKYKLPTPESIFTIDYFQTNPKPFCTLAKELYPGNFPPTPTHCFIRLLAEKNLLLRNFTQNIDTLEFGAGIPREKVVQAHGGFDSAHCLKCDTEYHPNYVKEILVNGDVPRCKVQRRSGNTCRGLVKPDIVFFGESLPQRFHELSAKDFPNCDLLIIMGTSLQVNPFAGLIDDVKENVVRMLFNREPAGVSDAPDLDDKDIAKLKAAAQEGDIRALIFMQRLKKKGLRIGKRNNTRDIFVKGDCDPCVKEFAKELGWEEDLEKIIIEVNEEFKKSSSKTSRTTEDDKSRPSRSGEEEKPSAKEEGKSSSKEEEKEKEVKK
mmetsp:Transcript_21528/g.32037  ORF Transcript_21528/g.32037 Transcript_21528/m.32037 type:complete len:402 (+) Transcript_21528:49-1254(+)